MVVGQRKVSEAGFDKRRQVFFFNGKHHAKSGSGHMYLWHRSFKVADYDFAIQQIGDVSKRE